MSHGNESRLSDPVVPGAPEALVADIRRLIMDARAGVAATVNAGLTLLYWRIGRRVRVDVPADGRAEYGERVVASLAGHLAWEFGQSFGEKPLRNMPRFADAFPDEEIVSALRRQLSWTHFRRLSYIDDPRKREFYAGMCRVERWSTRTLDARIDSMLYERTALSRKPELVFKDPCLLDFLGFRDRVHGRGWPRGRMCADGGDRRF